MARRASMMPFNAPQAVVTALLCTVLALGAAAQPAADVGGPGAATAAATAATPPDAAQPLAGSEPVVTATRLLPGERLQLDGRLDHPAWRRAVPHQAFVEKAPNTGAVPAHATEVRLLFDERALYVGVRCLDDTPGRIRAPLVKHDGVNRTQDFVVAYIDAIGSRQSAQFFRINAAGSMADGMHTAADDSEDFAPDFDWDGAAHQDAQGWTAVLRIPFAALRFASGPARPWRFMLGRRVPREQFFLHTSVLIPRDAPSFIHTLQPLQGVVLPESHQFFTLRPSLTWRRSDEQPGDGTRQRRQEVTASLDAKWRPAPELVLDATLRPDFSQVALDVPQLRGNTRFALQFEEKRPFFFESSDLLRSPTEALYSRSITEPRWGLRSTWRGQQLSGTAYAVDDKGGGLVLLPGPYGTGAVDQPAAKVLVARARGDAGALQWGGLASARQYAGGGHNQVAGPDLAWQISEAWRFRAQWLQSHTSRDAPGVDAATGQGAGAGHRAFAKLWYQAPMNEADLWLDDVGNAFRNDQGFAYQNGVRANGGRLAHGWLNLGPLNEFWFNLEGLAVRDRQRGSLVSRDLYPGIWMAGPHNLEYWLQWHRGAAQRIGPDTPLLAENYLNTGTTFTPAAWVPFVNAEAKLGRLADVTAGQVRRGGSGSVSLTLRPLTRLELEPKFSQLWLQEGGRLAYREIAQQVMARWHFSPQITLRAIVQHSAHDRRAEAATALRGAIAASADASTVGSLTWAWRQSAGSVLYVGASRSKAHTSVPPGGLPARGNEVFVKLQADLDDLRARWP